jgi:hypothetical protein
MSTQDAREVLKDPHWRLCFSLHEAAHILYGRRAGAIDVKYHGPGEYPDKPDGFFCAVELVFPAAIAAKMLSIARWHSAGSVVKRVLAPDYWVDDEDATDYEMFVRNFAAGSTDPATGAPPDPALISKCWKEAQQDVERDLRNPAFRRELWALAREVEKNIPWGEVEG